MWGILANIIISAAVSMAATIGAYNYLPLSFVEQFGPVSKRLGFPATITTIQSTDTLRDSRSTINNNFQALNENKVNISSTTWPQLTTATNLTTIGTLSSLGIGTSSPYTTLGVIGNLHLTGTTTGPGFRVASSTIQLNLFSRSIKSAVCADLDGSLTLSGCPSTDTALDYTWTGNHIFRNTVATSTFIDTNLLVGRAASSTFGGTLNLGGPVLGTQFLLASTTPIVVSEIFRGGNTDTGWSIGDGFSDAGCVVTAAAGNDGFDFGKDGSAAGCNIARTIGDTVSSSTPVFDMNPSFSTTFLMTAVNNANTDVCYSVMGTVGGSAIGLASNKYFGFELNNTSGAFSVAAVNSNATAQTRTVLTAGSGHPKNEATYTAIMYSGSRIEFFVNGVKQAVHTTNLPSGGLTNQTFMQMYFDGQAGLNAARCGWEMMNGAVGR